MSDRVQTTFLGQNFDFSNLFGIWSGMLKMAQKRLERLFFKHFCSCGARPGYPGLPPGYPAEHHNRDFIVVCSFLGVGRARKGVFASG